MKMKVVLVALVGVVAVSVSAFADDVADGAALFNAKGCVACHSVDGSPRVGPSMKGVFGKVEKVMVGGVEQTITVDDAYVKESILSPMAKVVVSFPPAMPPQSLSEADVSKLIAYIKSLK